MSGTTRIILFDLGGVLVETRGEQVVRDWVKDPDQAERVRSTWLTSSSLRAFESGRLSVNDFADAFTRELDLSVGRDLFVRVFTSIPGRLYPEVPALLDRLRDRYTLASLSNTNPLHWPRVSEEMGVEELLHHHFPSHLTGKMKPDREAFEQVVEHFACDPTTILFLDDQEINVTEARAVGMDAVVARGPKALQNVLEDRNLLS